MRVVQWRPVGCVSLAVAFAAGPVFAAPPAKTGGHATTVGHAATGAPLAGAGRSGVAGGTPAAVNNPKAQTETAMSLLRDAHRLVGGAHFAYGGHRAKAMKEIDRAIRELNPPEPNPNPQAQPRPAPSTQHAAGQGTRPAAPVVQQTQAEADAKMREALVLLTRAQGRIASGTGPADDVAAAIAELKTALKNP